MDRSIWSSKYTMGGITGFAACTTAWTAGGLSGLLGAGGLIALSAMWYFAGKAEAHRA